MLLSSTFTPLTSVALPYAGRQRYMHGFDVAAPDMGAGFEDYLAPVVALLRAAGVYAGKAWMTVDEKLVLAGCSQRRPGPHVDGKFNIKATKWGGGGGWNHSCNLVPTHRTPVIVAASVAGCRAWEGQFQATPRDDGDLSHIADQLGEGTILPANVGYLLSGDCVHESMAFTHDTQRTFLRIALPQLEGAVH
jgi:hypothetical protein